MLWWGVARVSAGVGFGRDGMGWAGARDERYGLGQGEGAGEKAGERRGRTSQALSAPGRVSGGR